MLIRSFIKVKAASNEAAYRTNCAANFRNSLPNSNQIFLYKRRCLKAWL